MDSAIVTGNTTLISLDGTVTNVWGMDGALYKSDTEWTLSGDAVIPSDMTITVAEGETFTVSADSSIKNNGSIVNNGKIELYGPIVGNDVTGNGTFDFYAAYIENVSSVSSISAKINGTAVTLEDGRYRLLGDNLYIWLPSGNAEVILNATKYYGNAVMGERVKLTTGYIPITDISGIPSQITAYVKTTLTPTTNATTFNPVFSYEIVSEGTTAPGAELNGSAIYASGSGKVKLKVTASDGYSSYSETFDIEVKDAGYTASIENGDITFEKYNDTQIKVTHTGFSEGYLIIGKDEYFSITGTSNTYDVTVNSGEVNIILNNCSISRNDYYEQPFSISAGASVNLVLTGNNDIVNDYNTDAGDNHAGIYLPSGASLTIDGTGSLDAKGGYYSAGIGGGNNGSAGELIINGGRINATGGIFGGAGIGGGDDGNGGTITINGGKIDATGGRYGGAGIGGGDNGNGGTITINGGTVTATSSSGAGIGGGYRGNGGTVTITGGNVKASSSSGTLKDANGNTVSLKTITLDGAAADTAVTAVTGMTYGVNDVYTLDTNKLYFYLAETPGESSITAGGTEYICNRNLTYYTSHSSAYDNITETTHDVVCSGCNAVITAGVSHVYNTDDKCVCGKINHTHEWKYVAEGTTTITATCMNTDSGCLDTDGGSVTIGKPENLTYNGKSKDATLSYTGWKPEEIPAITYSGEADRVKVTGKDITVSITVGDATATVTYQVEAASISGAIVTVDPNADLTYTGSAITPYVTVKLGDETLTEGVDYTVDYTDNTNAGTATITITGKGNYQGTATATFAIVDKTEPAGEILIKNNGWKQFWNWFTFGIFCKDNVDVTITADGTGSGVAKVEYLLSGTVLDENNLPAEGWTELTANNDGKYSFSITPQNKASVYVRITDEYDNVTVINSDGVVVYQDSEAVDTEVTYTYNENSNKDIAVTFNGNTVKSIVCGEATLVAGTDYTVDYDNSKIVLSADYLNTLNASDTAYDFTVSYDPMGVANSGVTDLADTTFTVKVGKAQISTVTVDVAAPEAGEEKQTEVAGGTGYSAAITWDCATEKFGYNTAYTAKVTLTADRNHTFTNDLTANGWAVVVSTDGTTATLTKTFEETRKEMLTEISTIENKTLSKYYTDVAEAIKELPTTITYTTESGEVTVDIEWACTDYDIAVTKTNTFTWTVKDGELDNYDVNDIATTGEITVTNASALSVENSGTDKSTTYNGNTYDVADMFTIDENAGEASYTIVGGTGAGTLNGSVLTITKAGTIEIKLTTAAQGAYDAGEATAMLTVNKGTGSGTVEISGWTYGEDAKIPVVNSSTNGTASVTYLYESTDGEGYSGSVAPENAGSYKLTVTFAETDLYEACTDVATFTIEQEELTPVISGSVTKVFDGKTDVPEQNGLSIVLDGIVAGDETKVFASASYAYAGTDVGTTTVNATNITLSGEASGNYKLTATTASAEVGTITQANPEYTVPESLQAIYGDTLEDVTLPDGFTWEDDMTTEVGNVGDKEFTVTYTPSDTLNYKTVTGITVSIHVKSAAASVVTAPTAISGLIYNKDAQVLITAGTASGGEMQYSSDGVTYSAEIPTGTGAGTYTIYYKVVGDSNHSDTTPVSIEVNIGKATYDMSGAMWNYTEAFDYDGKEHKVEVVGLPTGVAVSGYIGNTATKVGEYTAAVTFTYDRDNYNAPVLNDLAWEIKNDWTPAVNVEYTVSTPNSGGWMNTDFIVTASDGYELSYSNAADSIWSESLQVVNEDKGFVDFYVRNKATGTISLTAREGYQLDKTNPTGKVFFDERNGWETFVNTISFGLFYKDEVTVKVEANDSFSGIDSIEYVASDKAMTLDEVKAITDWTAMPENGAAATVEDAKQFVYYIRIIDKAGNVTYLSTNGAEYDITAPAISGIENGSTYYTTQKVNVTDKNPDTLTLNGEPVTGTITLEGNKETTYTIVVTDKAGNTTTVTVTMKQTESVGAPLDGITQENVTSADKETIQDVIDQVDELLDDEDMTEEEKAVLEEIKEEAEKLIDKIEEVAGATDTENIDKVENITSDNVKPEDKTDLENAKADLEKALEENGGNYTEDEKKAIQDEIDRIDEALEVIGNVEAVEDEINSLPENITKDDTDDVDAAKKAYDELSDYEKTLIDSDIKKKLDDAVKAAEEANRPVDTNSPTTGDNSNMALWFALLFISGGAVITLTVYDRKRRNAVSSK